MTSTEIDAACRSFLKSNTIPEDFLTEYANANHLKYTFEESKLLLDLLYDLTYVDTRMFHQLDKINQKGVLT